jgi:hypothetical protein
MEATFNKYGVAFLQILAGNLSLASPKRYIDEDGLLFFLAVFDGIDSVHGDADIRDGSASRGGSNFGIPCEITRNHDFVEIHKIL